MNEEERSKFVVTALKAAGEVLASEKKASNRPDLVPHHAPLNSERPLSDEELKRELIEEDEGLEEWYYA